MKNFLKKIIGLKTRQKILRFAFGLWYIFCRMLPLKNRVLFFSIRANGRLLDNAKAVYDKLDCKKAIFAVMVPHGILDSIKAYYMLLTSRVIITDDYLRYSREFNFRKDQKIFQIWHAAGAFKMFGLNAPSKLTEEQEKATHSQYSAVAVTSEKCRKYYSEAFGVDEDICIPVGLPRTDKLFTESDIMKASVYKRHPEFCNKHIYLYCPTFREKNGEKIIYDAKIDWDLLSASLAEDEVFVVRRHPIMNYTLFENTYNNIYDLSDESTLELTAASDVIITDYSSVIYDACLLNVPTVFYCPDYKEYERGFYLKFPDDLPGVLVTDNKNLLSAVRQTKEKPPVERIEKFKNRQLSACDGHSTERIIKIIEDWMK